jgi:hypothetical protein
MEAGTRRTTRGQVLGGAGRLPLHTRPRQRASLAAYLRPTQILQTRSPRNRTHTLNPGAPPWPCRMPHRAILHEPHIHPPPQKNRELWQKIDHTTWLSLSSTSPAPRREYTSPLRSGNGPTHWRATSQPTRCSRGSGKKRHDRDDVLGVSLPWGRRAKEADRHTKRGEKSPPTNRRSMQQTYLHRGNSRSYGARPARQISRP